MIDDLSDEGLVSRFGDLMFEIPELFEAIRMSELKSRSLSTESGFNCRADGVSVKRDVGGLKVLIGSRPG